MSLSSFIYFCFSVILIHSATASETELLVSKGDGFRPNVHNYLVMLVVSLHDSSGILKCSGSIIDKKWIITSAHCFPHNTDLIIIIQRIHARHRAIGFSREYANHPNFTHDRNDFNDHNSLENDLALVKTKKPIKLNAYTQPIALSRLGAFGQQGTIAGYGESEFGSGIPLEGTVIVTRCKSRPHNSRMLCSQSLAYVNKGDSGGALKTDDGLIGVVAALASLPTGIESVYVDISVHCNWIHQVTGMTLRDTSCA